MVGFVVVTKTSANFLPSLCFASTISPFHSSLPILSYARIGELSMTSLSFLSSSETSEVDAVPYPCNLTDLSQ